MLLNPRSVSELRYVSWDEFDGICRGLARRLASFEVELVVGIARGGLPAAVHLAHLLDAPYFGTVHATKTPSNEAFAIAAGDGVELHGSMLPAAPVRRALLVEDIVTFGDVFQRVTPLVGDRYGPGVEVVHATLFADLEQITTGPNPGLLESLFYGEAIDNRAVWIVPPWDEKHRSEADVSA
jgi:hypoxanthine phosphoribosyltransferase